MLVIVQTASQPVKVAQCVELYLIYTYMDTGDSLNAGSSVIVYFHVRRDTRVARSLYA